jgi:ABC-type transport system substrate-binding protein/serine/threonine protein kinase
MADRSGEHFGNYRLVRLLGQGGFAEVYLGQHLRLSQQAAIKVLHAHLTESETEHFQQEGQTISTLIHPSIIRVLDYDVQDGVPFLVMDYAPGGSLRKLHPRGSPVPLSQIVTYVKQMADALQYAHEQKLIHRDVKPENMLLGRRGEVLLSDFGIATVAHSSGSLSTKEAVGTLSYMAPEQIEGHPRAASDQYALGCVVYEWLCGARPFEGSPTEVMVQQLSMPPAPLHEKVAAVPLGVEQVVLRALAKNPKQRFPSVHDFAAALERASQLAYSPTSHIPSEQPLPGSLAPASFATIAVPDETPSVPVVSSMSPETPAEPGTSPDLTGNAALAATVPATPSLVMTPAGVPSLPRRARPQRKTIVGLPAALLIGLAVLVVVGGLLGSLSLLGAHSTPVPPARGGTWMDDVLLEPSSLIPNGDSGSPDASVLMDQALYLPLFYGDAQGVVFPGAASVVPTVQNGAISADGKTWTFHLRPHLVWSDGQPYDARDVDFTWRLWSNPKFGAAFSSTGMNLISTADVSADRLSITFHLKQAYAPFLSGWVDGLLAPLPAHHFSSVAPEAILKSPENLNPHVVSGPFMMAESKPGDHYTLVRNSRYYRANQGLPYLDKLVFRIVLDDVNVVLKDLQVGSADSVWGLNWFYRSQMQHLTHYTFVTSPTSGFEAMFFNFHNSVLASRLEVRQAMAMAMDQQALIQQARHGFASALCTDHPDILHLANYPAFCPEFNPAAADKVLNDNGWVRGSDGVRARGNQRLEFEYSTTTNNPWRLEDEAILERNFQAIGIKLDIQNYPASTFFGPFLSGGLASPPTGAVAGRFDIAEFANSYYYDPDDSLLFACDQAPPKGYNVGFYCNPALDALYKQELSTVDPVERPSIFGQIHQIYLAQLPFITLYEMIDIGVAHTGTHNYQISPFSDEGTNIWEWWCDNGKC